MKRLETGERSLSEGKKGDRPAENQPIVTSPEIWGGIECSINRVKNSFFDQLEMSGHYGRDTDIDLIAGLGIKRMRFPILWERQEPVKGLPIDWQWVDNRLNQLRSHSIEPIAGLVHHGSGSAFTDLRSASFATGLASYAGKVAKRYPWLEYYIPVNEPLTTARFSGLYGYWYPHGKSDSSFCVMLLNQLKAVVLSMQEIRKVNPTAKLIQTEDLGKTYSVPSLQYQADFDNDRRWLSFDFLCGHVNKEHPLWDFFIRSGIKKESLQFFQDNPCPPSLLGLNHYVTSERFLDDRLQRFPKDMHAGNWLDAYVDTEAVRVDHGQPSGLRTLLDEAQARYDLPMAITEAHLNCTREEQMRWFKEVWDICCDFNKERFAIEAVTAWSLMGAFGWNKLLTTAVRDYEPGVFDLRGSAPRPTAMARLIRSLSKTNEYFHPVLSQKGWWHRAQRFTRKSRHRESLPPSSSDAHTPPILIIGKDGVLVKEYISAMESRALCYRQFNPDAVSSSDKKALEETIRSCRPWSVIYATTDPQDAEARLFVARACKKHRIKFLGFTVDSAYHSILAAVPSALVINTGKLIDAQDHQEFIVREDGTFESEKVLTQSKSVSESLRSIPDVVNVSLDLLIDDECGKWDLTQNVNPIVPSLLERSQVI